MGGPDRKQILRIDCTTCRGNGYTTTGGSESACEKCSGSGQLEKEVGYKFETMGRWTNEEIAEVFGIKVDEVKDVGHDAPEDKHHEKIS